MARKLVDEMSAKWNPQRFHDTYREDLMRRIREKVKKNETHVLGYRAQESAASQGRGDRSDGCTERQPEAAGQAGPARCAEIRARAQTRLMIALNVRRCNHCRAYAYAWMRRKLL